MVTVAIAGTGHVGSHVAKAILATKKYDVIILSRSTSIPELEKLGAKVAQVAYDDPASLDRALAGVHTVISTVSSMDYTVFASAQLPLIDAAVRAGVTRFAPSEFDIRASHDDPIEVYRPKAVVADHVRKSGLQYTFFETGLYMNFLGGGKDGSGVDHLPGLPIDIGAGKARLPGDGTSRVAWTRVQDIAAYVAASLDLEEWPEVSRLAGEIISWNDLIALAETVRGKKFDLTYRSKEQLEALLDPHPANAFVNLFEVYDLEFIKGRFDFKDLTLSKLLPQVKPMGMKEYLETVWSLQAHD